MNIIKSIFIYFVLLFTLYHPKDYSLFVFNDVETSADVPFYQHQTFCVIYDKQFSSLKYG